MTLVHNIYCTVMQRFVHGCFLPLHSHPLTWEGKSKFLVYCILRYTGYLILWWYKMTKVSCAVISASLMWGVVMRDEVMATDDDDDMYDHLPSSLSTSFWSFCTDLSANSARASAYGESMCFNHCQNITKIIFHDICNSEHCFVMELNIYIQFWLVYLVQLAEYIYWATGVWLGPLIW